MDKEAVVVHEDGTEWIYQPIHFTPAIMSEYYVGNEFIGLNISEELQSGELNRRMERAGMDGFMPVLVREITEIIGEKNQKYDGYEFSEDEVSFYFMINKSEHDHLMNNIKYWAILKDFDHMISYETKKVQYALVR